VDDLQVCVTLKNSN